MDVIKMVTDEEVDVSGKMAEDIPSVPESEKKSEKEVDGATAAYVSVAIAADPYGAAADAAPEENKFIDTTEQQEATPVADGIEKKGDTSTTNKSETVVDTAENKEEEAEPQWHRRGRMWPSARRKKRPRSRKSRMRLACRQSRRTLLNREKEHSHRRKKDDEVVDGAATAASVTAEEKPVDDAAVPVQEAAAFVEVSEKKAEEKAPASPEEKKSEIYDGEQVEATEKKRKLAIKKRL